MPERWRQLAALSLAELLALSLWFSASAVLPALQREWALGPGGSAGLTIAVQLGFIAGTLASALTNLPDIWSARHLMAGSALVGPRLASSSAAASTTTRSWSLSRSCNRPSSAWPSENAFPWRSLACPATASAIT